MSVCNRVANKRTSLCSLLQSLADYGIGKMKLIAHCVSEIGKECLKGTILSNSR